MTSCPRHLRPCLLLGALLLVSCEPGTEVRDTIPRGSETDVDPRSIVAVEISNGIRDTDTTALDPANFRVTGDLSSSPYTGSLVLANRKYIKRGQTVEEFRAAIAAIDTTQVTSLPTTIVFLLDDGEQFKDGEIIRVEVRQKVTANGAPLRKSKSFSFRVRGGTGAQGELRVASTEPPLESRGAAASRPRLLGRFTRGVAAQGLGERIHIRGELSGVHTPASTLLTSTTTSGSVLEVVSRLADGDSFSPGERVSLAFDSTIKEPSQGASAGASLVPYLGAFQVESGLVGGSWAPLPAGPPLSGPRSLAVGDSLSDRAGVEAIVASDERLTLQLQSASRLWSSSDARLPAASEGSPWKVVGAFALDLDGDGAPEACVLRTRETESQALVYKVGADGVLAAFGKPTSIPAPSIEQWLVVDLDASGTPEVLLSHPSSKVDLGGKSQSTGFVSLLEVQSIPPDPADIDPANPDSLLPKPGFVAISRPFPAIGAVVAWRAADLDLDGRTDLVIESTGSTALYRNIASASAKYALRETVTLNGRDGGPFAGALGWVAMDVEDDGDLDLVAWDAQGPLLFRNPYVSDAVQPGELPRSLLDEAALPESALQLPTLSGPARLIAQDLNGDAVADLVVLEAERLRLLLGKAPADLGGDLPFQTIELPLAHASVGLAIADVDGDTGLDVVLCEEETGQAVYYLSSGVEPIEPTVSSSVSIAPESSGLTQIGPDLLRVAVIGDFTERFTGYAVALDYSEDLLQYRGFEIPTNFERSGTFTTCPDANLQGCAGSASAKMAYRQGTVGGRGTDILLGTFLFSPRSVSVASIAKVQLMTFTSANTTFANTLNIQDGSATLELPLTPRDDLLEIHLLPPPPTELVAQCTVLERLDKLLRGRVEWSSPAGKIFSQYEVRVAGGGTVSLPSTAGFLDFETSLTGVIPVTVMGFDAGGGKATAQCDVLGIHSPTVNCVAVGPDENRISWSLAQAAERFRVYRNGAFIHETPDGSRLDYSDTSPSTVGQDNYEVSAIVSGVEGARGACAGGPVGDDPDPVNVAAPTFTESTLLARVAPSDPNRLRFRWQNAEAYDALTLSLFQEGDEQPVLTRELGGAATELVYEGDLSKGGVRPQRYSLTITGRAKGTDSATRRSQNVTVPVPVLSVPFQCSTDALGNAVLVWSQVWRGYSALELVISHDAGDGSPPTTTRVPLSLETTSHTERGLAPFGVYTFTLSASYTEALPDSLKPLAQSLQKSCDVGYDAALFVGVVTVGVGQTSAEIPVRARFLSLVEGFRFELEVPGFLEIDPLSGLEVDWPGAVVSQFTLAAGEAPGTRKIIAAVRDAQILPETNGGNGTVLARIIARVPGDFSLAGDRPLVLRGTPVLSFLDRGDVPLGADTTGKLRVVRRHMTLDKGVVVAGSTDAVRLTARATFDAPASSPDYRINGFTVHLKWNRDLLDIQPVTLADQAQSAVAGRGSYFLPNDVALARARETGELLASWTGFDFSHPTDGFQFLYPGINQNLLVVRFRSKLAATDPATFAAVEFFTDPGPTSNPTALFPEVDDPSQPELEAFFDGGIRIDSDVQPFRLLGVSPAQGSLLGGNEAVISGTGLLGGELGIEIVRSGVGGAVTLPVTSILERKATSIRFLMPDSGLRQPTQFSTPADVRVRIGDVVQVLANAYSFEFPRLTGSDITQGRASGGLLMVVSGVGLAPGSLVRFLVPGVAAPFPAAVTDVSADGTRLFLVTPDLRGHESKKASVEVEVPEVGTVLLPNEFLILADGGSGPTLKLTSVSPSEGLICGGDLITLAGDGFLRTMEVSFGSFSGLEVDVVDGRTARVRTPSVPEGTSLVDVRVAIPGGVLAALPSGFRFTHPGGEFLRGDIDSSGTITVTDAVILADLVLGKAVTFPPNLDAADVNDDGVINGGDVTALTGFLFGSLQALPQPYPSSGLDPTPDNLTSCGE